MGQLLDVLEKFQNRKTYQELDRRALDISRKAASGNLGEGEYADWAMISNDPLVVANIVDTFITVLTSRLSSSPFRPEKDELAELGIKLKFNALFTETYKNVLSDGYAFVSIGFDAERMVPLLSPVDARHIMYLGDEPSLKDSTDILIFQIKAKDLETDVFDNIMFPEGYVEFNSQEEQVDVYHYTNRNGKIKLDIYDKDDKPHTSIDLDMLNRIPVIRFVGKTTELEDKKHHYRGLYHHVAPVFKAMTLAATKLQIQTSMIDDDGYMACKDAIANHLDRWESAGVKIYDRKTANGGDIPAPTPIPKNIGELTQVYDTWKNTLADMLGPVVQSSSEAITREEVIARNEVRDAITNVYLTRMADGIAEVYSIISQFLFHDSMPVVILGGYLEHVKKEKQKAELQQVYQLARESGLNTQGFAYEFLMLSDVNIDLKERIKETFSADPNASPKVVELNQQIQALQTEIQNRDHNIAILRTQASQRLERQKEYVSMVERTKRMEIAFKQWKQESQDAQAARLEMMKAAIASGDVDTAVKLLAAMEDRDHLMLAQREVEQSVAESDMHYMNAEPMIPDQPQPQPQPQPQLSDNGIPKGWG